MKCDRCDNEANIEILISKGGDQMNTSLCFECYEKFTDENLDILMDTSLMDILEALSKEYIEDRKTRIKTTLGLIGDDEKCLKCSRTISDIILDFAYGCEYCYAEFRPRIEDILGEDADLIEGPVSNEDEDLWTIKINLEKQEILLKEYISKEEYEKAARIKVSIDQLRYELDQINQSGREREE